MFTTAEIRNTLHGFNDSKAPGPDSIDFKMLKIVFKILPQLITRWANLCLKLKYFPQALREGEVVYFLKKGKISSEPDSYRPICLLPTLGKLLEKLIVNRLTFFLESNSILHERQFGFREGRSCDKALSSILSSCTSFINQGLYTSLVSLDIKGAFDNVEWRDILLQLSSINCPSNLAEIIRTYLSNRTILINWGAGYSHHRQEKGCPQGSCLGPILWLLIANVILNNLTALGFILYAFADDFCFIITGKRRVDLESMAASALTAFCHILTSLNLHLSESKSQALTFAQPHDLKKRYPTIRINNKSIKHVQNLKLLGLSIDRHLNWFSHINFLKIKLLRHFHNSLKLTTKLWGVNNKILRVWYLTVVEKIITYGAGIWGDRLTQAAKAKLTSIQRMFLLQMSRGYRTISSDALNVITSIPPITLTIDYEYNRCRILHLQDEQITRSLFPVQKIQYKIPTWRFHPAVESSHLHVNPTLNSYSPTPRLAVYTDGSQTESGVGAAFCAFEGGTVTHEWSARLGDFNSVYQAELFAIFQALLWIKQQSKDNIPLFTDSLSSLQSIMMFKTNHPQVQEIKLHLSTLPKTTLKHVKAHSGVPGNELADSLAKAATAKTSIDFSLPIPPSYIKKILKINLQSSWQEHWAASTKGRYTYNLIPRIPKSPLNLTFFTTSFLTGHGPFRAYLNRFKRARTSMCPCGDFGDANHFYFVCQLTAAWHIRRPDPPPPRWLTEILSRPTLLNKLKCCHMFLHDLSNLID